MRAVICVFLAAMAGIFGWSLGAGLTGSWVVGWLLGAAAAAGAGWLAWRGALVPLDRAAVSRGLVVVSALAAAFAIVQYGRLTVFMADPSRTEYSFAPGSRWETRHSCVTAYFVAARAASATPNVYVDSLYTSPDDDPTKLRKPKMMGPLGIDVYEYPPTFLLLPRAIRLLVPEWEPFRLLWFGFQGAVVLLALVVVARFLGGAAGTRALLCAPLVFAAVPTISTMQKGNVQHVVIAASMLAMILFERKRWIAGGALLSFATASKLYPGLLVIYLIARREWRAVAWTTGLGLVLIAATIVDVGAGAHAAFMTHLPGLLSGEAFPAFRNPAAVAINTSIPGLVFKSKLFGGPALSFDAARAVGWIYSAIAIAVAIWAARRMPRSAGGQPLVWLALLVVATLRSPFLPQTYAAFPPVWLLTLVAATSASGGKPLVAAAFGWMALSLYWPQDGGLDPRGLALANLATLAATIAVTALALVRGSRPIPTPGVEDASKG